MIWLKVNWFKLAVLIMVSAFGSYYLFIILPAQEQSNKISDCRELGNSYRKSEIADNKNISFFVPKYTYNKKLDTCIYSGGFIDSVESEGVTQRFVDKYIIDINTNTTLYSSTKLDGELVAGIDGDEFSEKEKGLFGELE